VELIRRFDVGDLFEQVHQFGQVERPVGPTFKPNSKMCISGFAAIQVSTVTITPQRA
jgi:hypothetical protein